MVSVRAVKTRVPWRVKICDPSQFKISLLSLSWAPMEIDAVQNFVNHQYNLRPSVLRTPKAPDIVLKMVRAAAIVVISSLSQLEKKALRNAKLGIDRLRSWWVDVPGATPLRSEVLIG